MNSYLELSYYQVLQASILVIIQALISILLKLDLFKSIIISTLRMVIQLLILSLVLETVFKSKNSMLVIFIISIMTFFASHTSISRTKLSYKREYFNALLSIFLSAWLNISIMIFFINTPSPWYLPQYVVPLAGFILGNSFNSISISLDKFLDLINNSREKSEMLMSYGATIWESIRDDYKEAVRVGMMPILNSMLASGIINIPGMMTGQILSGTSPYNAVKYQIILMFLILSSTITGILIILYLTYRSISESNVRIKYESISRRK